MKESKKKFKERKEALFNSLKEVENFLWNWKKTSKGIHLLKALKR